MIRWRKEPNETGLRSVGQCPRGYELRDGEEILIHVSADGGGWQRPLAGWYWYGADMRGKDSGRFKTAEEAKANADAYFKANKGKFTTSRTRNG